MEKIVSLCKRRGFVFPSSEIYGGLGSTYDYGPLRGAPQDATSSNEWWRSMLQERDDIVALDSAILQHPRVWEASGHLEGFTDPLVDCRACKQRFRADHVDPRRDVPGQGEPAQDRGPPPRVHRGARLQPHVQDVRRPRRGDRVGHLPAPGDGAGHLHQLQERPAVQPPQAAVRHRADRQVVPQRDHARQLHLPHARVRADGDGVLRAAGRGGRLVRALEERALHLVRGPRHPHRPPAAARARRRRAQPLLVGDRRRRVPLPHRLVRARGHRQPRRLRPHAPHASSAARSSSTSTRRPATATSRTSSSPPPAPTARRSRSSSTPTTRRRSRATRGPCCGCTRGSRR